MSEAKWPYPWAEDCATKYSYAPGEMGTVDTRGHHPSCMNHVDHQLREAQGRTRELTTALHNVRRLAKTMKKGTTDLSPAEYADHLLRFCNEVGVKGSLLRLAAGETEAPT